MNMEQYIGFDPLAWAAQPELPQTDSEVKASCEEPAPATAAANDDCEKIMAVGQELLQMGANIADDYGDWIRLGFALADGLGAEGRDLFHQLSAASAKYCEADCEKKCQQCLAKGNGRTTIKTFYFVAQQAGVDLSEIGRRFPSNPQFPQPEGEELEYIYNRYIATSSDLPQAEGSEGMRETPCEQTQNFSETFSDKLSLDELPSVAGRNIEPKRGRGQGQDDSGYTQLPLRSCARGVWGL